MPALRASPASTRGSSHHPFFPSRRKTIVGAHPAACRQRARAFKLEIALQSTLTSCFNFVSDTHERKTCDQIGTAEPSGINDHASLDSRGLPKRKVPVSAQHPNVFKMFVARRLTDAVTNVPEIKKLHKKPRLQATGDGEFEPNASTGTRAGGNWPKVMGQEYSEVVWQKRLSLLVISESQTTPDSLFLRDY
ncbi:hypothetical protein K438DRAFT_1948009 [Mycena galopus ATCC 62051]|nr:hypothetical protein K438DRAFT_1948009 [Mycena galopus ATCC 62051]